MSQLFRFLTLPLLSLFVSLTMITNQAMATNPSVSEENKVMIKMTTNKGDILIELNPEAAPVTVENFLTYVNKGHYNGLVFHRVISDFMIQGGGMNESMEEAETMAPIAIESDNGLKNDRGTIAMARTMVPDSATSQFFINLKNNDFLNFKDKSTNGWGYAVFGQVTEGMDVVDAIAAVDTGSRAGHQDVPKEPVIIESVEVIE